MNALRLASARHLLAFMGLAVLLAAPPARAQARYTVTDLGTLGGKTSQAYAINSANQIVGQADTSVSGQSHAFFYSQGQMTDIDTAGSSISVAYGLNNLGQATGAFTVSGVTHAFFYNQGQMTDIGTLGGKSSTGYALNDSGQITGSASNSFQVTHAFLYDGAMHDLGTLGGTVSVGSGVNSSGQVTGYAYLSGNSVDHAFLYSNGQMTDIGTLGGKYSDGTALNDSTQITGGAYTASGGGHHPFRYSSGQMTDLGLLGGGNGYGRSINTQGIVVGFSDTATAGVEHAFVTVSGASTDLNGLIAAGSGWTLTKANGINDAGWIVGVGTHVVGGVKLARAFLLTPIASGPTLASISPASASAGSPALTLHVTGSRFVSGSVVQWNGMALTTSYVSASKLNAAVPASLLASPGMASITVINPSGSVSGAKTFSIKA